MNEDNSQLMRRLKILPWVALGLLAVSSILDSVVSSKCTGISPYMLSAFAVGVVLGLGVGRAALIDRLLLLSLAIIACAANYVTTHTVVCRHPAHDWLAVPLALAVAVYAEYINRGKAMFRLCGGLASAWILLPRSNLSSPSGLSIPFLLCAVVAGILLGYSEFSRQRHRLESSDSRSIYSASERT